MEMKELELIFDSIDKFKKVDLFSKVLTNLTHSEFMLMNLIKCNSGSEGIKSSNIASIMMISNPAVSQMINGLEDKGYVERVTTKNDRRVVYVRLTELGRELLEKEKNVLVAFFSKILDRMGKEDSYRLMELVNKFCAVAKDAVKN